jgi:alpha(1,3/1,4) fucosyltransferase
MNKNVNVALYIEPPSHHFFGDKLFDVSQVRLAGDQLMAPYAYLRDFLNARGVEVHTADLMPQETNGKKNIYVSLGILSNYRRLAQRPDTVLSAYFALECPIVEPSIYRALPQVQRYFKRIYSWSDSVSLERFVGESVRCESFCWAQSFDDVHEALWSNTDRKFLVMINANKLPRLYWQELYTERMRAVEFFSRTDDIDLYGKGWDKPSMRVGKTWMPYTFRRIHYEMIRQWQRIRPNPLLQAAQRAYRGVADSKSETLARYKFALCFENSILKGWITEKLFDCFFAGTVPIYWGAPDITERVPANCFIDMRRFSGYQELREFLKSLSEKHIQEYKVNARAFLRSPEFYPFTKAAFAELFARVVEEDAGVQL